MVGLVIYDGTNEKEVEDFTNGKIIYYNLVTSVRSSIKPLVPYLTCIELYNPYRYFLLEKGDYITREGDNVKVMPKELYYESKEEKSELGSSEEMV